MKILGYTVRWIDDKGLNHKKSYDDEKTARKAADWLVNNGADRVDVAVVVEQEVKVEE